MIWYRVYSMTAPRLLSRLPLLCTLYFLLSGFSTLIDGQCNGKHHHIMDESGLATAPDSLSRRESCSWEFSFPASPKMLVLNFKKIRLFYENGRIDSTGQYRKWCTQNLTAGYFYFKRERNNCYWNQPFCDIYYQDNKCSNSNVSPECTFNRWQTGPVKVSFNASTGAGKRKGEHYWNYAEGFRMEFRYIDCRDETTTAYTVTMTTAPTTSETTVPLLSTTPETTFQFSTIAETFHIPKTTFSADRKASTSNAALAYTGHAHTTKANSTIPDTDKLDDGSNTTVIVAVLSCVLLVLLILALLAVLRRRNQNKKPVASPENEYQEVDDVAVYSMAHNNIEVGSTRQATNVSDRNTYASVASPRQSEIATYSPLNLESVGSQSNFRAQDIDQSTYFTLDHGGRFNQSQPSNATTSQSDASVYSAISREPGARKVTVRYKVQSNTDGNQQTGQNMVENVLYASR